MQCADVAGAVTMLVRADARMLDALAWRGTAVPATIARWRPDQFVEVSDRLLARPNPWAGIAGCVYMGGAGGLARLLRRRVARHRGADLSAARAARRHGRDHRRSAASHRRRTRLRAAHRGRAVEGASVAARDAAVARPAAAARERAPRRVCGGRLRRQRCGNEFLARRKPHSSRRNAGRRRLFGRPHDRSRRAGDRADDRRLLHRPAGRVRGRRRRAQGGQAQPIGHRLLEHAVVRMAAVAIIDVATGRIEALAGSLSPCTREEYDGPGRLADCDRRMPYPIRYRPDALLNPAVFHDAMPASVIKPIMAAAFLSDPDVGPRWLASERADWQRTDWPSPDSLRGQLMRSDSARFLDRMFCADTRLRSLPPPMGDPAGGARLRLEHALCGSARGLRQARPALRRRRRRRIRPSLRAIRDVGSVRAPHGRARGRQARRPDPPAACGRARPRESARLRVRCRRRSPEPGRLGEVPRSDPGRRRRRRLGPGQRALERAGRRRNDGGARGRRQRRARARAAPRRWRAPRRRGRPESPRACAVGHGRPTRAGPPFIRCGELILSALSYSHRAGTARLACEQLFDPRTCRDIDWIAGKTGTPTFPNDDVSLDELARLCAKPGTKTRKEEAACGALRPYKWYVAAYRMDPASSRWSKAIGVLTERNWVADTGRIHGAGDHGPNPAAEIALQIAARHTGFLAGDSK